LLFFPVVAVKDTRAALIGRWPPDCQQLCDKTRY
jgi:hypothetical protein